MPHLSITALAFGFRGMPPNFERRFALGKIIRRLNPNIPWVAIIDFAPPESTIASELQDAKKHFPHTTMETLVFTGTDTVFHEALHVLKTPVEAKNALFVDNNPSTLALASAVGFQTEYFDYKRDPVNRLQKLLRKHVLMES